MNLPKALPFHKSQEGLNEKIMDRTLKKELKKFLKTVESNLFCCKEEKKKIVSSLENDINIQVEDGTISTISDVLELFGTPESIASSYPINKSDVAKLRNTPKVILKAVIITLAIIVALFTACILFEVIRAQLGGRRYQYIDVRSISSVTAPPIT